MRRDSKLWQNGNSRLLKYILKGVSEMDFGYYFTVLAQAGQDIRYVLKLVVRDQQIPVSWEIWTPLGNIREAEGPLEGITANYTLKTLSTGRSGTQQAALYGTLYRWRPFNCVQEAAYELELSGMKWSAVYKGMKQLGAAAPTRAAASIPMLFGRRVA